MQIPIRYIRDIMPVEAIENGDWIDLRAAEDVHLKPFEFCRIPLGIAMQLPDGYEALVVPRSSTFEKYGILQTNSIGVIDNSYGGNDDEWKFPALAVRETTIHKNERICQFRIIRNQEGIELVTKHILYGKNRGGFGTTGTI